MVIVIIKNMIQMAVLRVKLWRPVFLRSHRLKTLSTYLSWYLYHDTMIIIELWCDYTENMPLP